MGMRIGIVGGTGKEGKGLAIRWAKAGHSVSIGSRDADRAKARAEELSVEAKVAIAGGSNETIAAESDVVLLSVPYSAHAETLRALKEHIKGFVIDITVPLRPPKVTQVNLPQGGSAALEAQEILGPQIPVVAALHHVSSVHLGDPDHALECDVLVCSNDAKSLATTIDLIKDLGTRGIDAGPLQNAVALESLTPVLLHINRRYKASGAGIRFVGIPTEN